METNGMQAKGALGGTGFAPAATRPKEQQTGTTHMALDDIPTAGKDGPKMFSLTDPRAPKYQTEERQGFHL